MRQLFNKIRRRLHSGINGLRYRGSPQTIVAAGYDQMAERYGEWTLEHTRPDRHKYTQRLLQDLPAGAEVLELGCGPGEPTTRALTERFTVTANDISASCLALARQNAPNADFLQGDMTALALPNDRFDAVTAFYAFHHVPRERYAGLLRSICGWLREDGLLVAAFYPQDIDSQLTDDWHGAMMYWSSFDADVTRRLIRDAGLRIDHESFESAVEDGRETTFLWITARKATTAPASAAAARN